ncbi:MAG: methyltransferase domain-containing protein [Caldilineaceae bacterium]|nr:methyltransferase domain-containing protein [Caldilineaceae bacterium]
MAVNRDFYATVADHFDATRQGWTPGQLAILPYFHAGSKEDPLSVLDVGCGNGRFARLLHEEGVPCRYTGVDGDARLLALAANATADLDGSDAHFHQADLADPAWAAPLAEQTFDVVLCLATVQHLPGYDLRLRLLRDFHRLSRGWALLSFWQFLTSQRFSTKQIDWSAVGLSAEDVEPGDALLPWRQGVHAVRYVHQVDEPELRQLAADAGWQIHNTFRADGKEGDLNLYAVLEREQLAVSG